MNDIIIKSLNKSFKDKKVIENLNLTLQGGKTTCIMGASGCGKTTLLRILAGLEHKDSGEIINLSEKISFIFQEDRLSESFNAVSNIRFVTGKTVPDEVIIKTLNDLGINEYLDKSVSSMSGGMKRRVAIARSLLVPYDILFMDEPFKGLDEDLKKSVMDYIKEKTKGKTVIFVTHDKTESEYMSDIIYTMIRKKS